MPLAGWVKTRDPSAPFNDLHILHMKRAAKRVGQYFECIGKLHQGKNKTNSTCKARVGFGVHLYKANFL